MPVNLEDLASCAKLCETMVPYEVVNVADCLKPPRVFNFPKPEGDSYYITRYFGKRRWTVEYLPIFGGFDIETTNIIEKDEKNEKGVIKKHGKKHAYAYHMQMSIFSWKRGMVYLARTWKEVDILFKKVTEFYGITETRRIIQWIANCSFEFTFMARRFTWSQNPFDFFAKEKRQPLLFTLAPGLEFRECLSISGGSLAQLCKDYTYTQKKKDPVTGASDLDYSKLRNSTTELDKTELGYVVSDVVPLAEWGAMIAERYMRDDEPCIPLTKTSIIRTEVKRSAKTLLKGRISDWKKLLIEAQPSYPVYLTWRKHLLRGGMVHGKEELVGVILGMQEPPGPDVVEDPDVYLDAWDITSSYPSCMLTEKFPTKFVGMPVNYQNEEQFDKIALDPNIAFIAKVTFYDLEATLGHSLESSEKPTMLLGAKLDNGRIKSAKECSVYLTNWDWLNYRDIYRWSKCHVETAVWSETMWLPPYLTDCLKKHYIAKAKLKKEGKKDTVEYAISKQAVNSFFGLCIQGFATESWMYGDGVWYVDEKEGAFDEEREKALLLQSWGIFTAAMARRHLIQVLARIEREVGCDYPHGIVAYGDTDSLKMLHDPRTDAIIEEYNEGVRQKLKERGLTDPAFDDLGCYAREEKYRRFACLGAKRYLYEYWDEDKNDWVIKATIAGLPKLAIKALGEDPFEKFVLEDIDFEIDEKYHKCFSIDEYNSMKTTHAYNDWETEDIVDGELMHEESSVAIYSIPFTLKLTDDYYRELGQYLIDKARRL